jgi:hypothetical protein
MDMRFLILVFSGFGLGFLAVLCIALIVMRRGWPKGD